MAGSLPLPRRAAHGLLVAALPLVVTAQPGDATATTGLPPFDAVLPSPQSVQLCESAERGAMCTQQYDPVCALVDTRIRCVTTPCDSPRRETRPNACSACADEQVVGWLPGECGS